MSVQDVNVEKLDVQEAKKASYGVNAEVPDATGVNATPPGSAPQAGDKSGPTTQGSGIKPYTKVGMINAMVQSLGSMKKMEVSSAYDAMHGKKSKPVAEVSHDSGKNAKMSKITKEDIDITQDIEAIFAGADVSEEFITKASEVFEAAVLAKVNEQIQAMDEQFQSAITEETSTISEELVERVDAYLDYVVEQWMENNTVAIERGLKAEIVESFMTGLKGLFEEHYIDIPDEAVDVAEQLATQVEVLEGAINEEIEKNVELTARIKEFECANAFAEVAEGLTDTQIAKLSSLSESVEFENASSFKKKIGTLRESYFPSKTSAGSLSESVTLDEEPVGDDFVEKQVPVEMAAYMTAITRGIKK
jgi:hypothetical protein